MKKIILIVLALLCLAGCYSEYYTKEDLEIAISEAMEEGYDSGYNDGFEEAESEFQYIREDAYSEGYEEGFSDGEDAVIQWEEENAETYDDGYEYGLEIGYSAGYEDGYDQGYSDGKKTKTRGASSSAVPEQPEYNYVINKNTKKFHYTWCSSVNDIKSSNRWNYSGMRDDIIDMGYSPCKKCNP